MLGWRPQPCVSSLQLDVGCPVVRAAAIPDAMLLPTDECFVVPHFNNHPLVTRSVYMDDNARPHRSRAVTGYLQSEAGTSVPWPVMSPDSNPIERPSITWIRNRLSSDQWILRPVLKFQPRRAKHHANRDCRCRSTNSERLMTLFDLRWFLTVLEMANNRHTTGMSFKASGRQMGYHYTVVSRLVRKHTQTNNVKNLPRSDRPRVTSDRNMSQICSIGFNSGLMTGQGT
jgi:hypothetical protein